MGGSTFTKDPDPKELVLENFSKIFGDDGNIRVFFAPGRVNLIGEHTDYNGGHVFPCALNLGTYAACRLREDKIFRMYSVNFPKAGVIEADSSRELKNLKKYKWANYPLGIVHTFKKHGYDIKQGMDIVFYGDIPNGSGLSSSASIEVLTGFALSKLLGIKVSKKELALIGQESENKFNGMNCGIMDQFASAFGKKGHAIFLDTATLEYEYVPVNLKNYSIVIANTKVKHELTTSAYNDRRRESEEALKDLQTVVDIKSLGELSGYGFKKYSKAIRDKVCFRRARHAVTENLRTIKAVKALNENDLETFGKLMIESHKSLDKDYEVTCDELNLMVDSELETAGVLGARMTGGGFGGCTVALAEKKNAALLCVEAGTRYYTSCGIAPEFYVIEVGDGPREL